MASNERHWKQSEGRGRLGEDQRVAGEEKRGSGWASGKRMAAIDTLPSEERTRSPDWASAEPPQVAWPCWAEDTVPTAFVGCSDRYRAGRWEQMRTSSGIRHIASPPWAVGPGWEQGSQEEVAS